MPFHVLPASVLPAAPRLSLGLLPPLRSPRCLLRRLLRQTFSGSIFSFSHFLSTVFPACLSTVFPACQLSLQRLLPSFRRVIRLSGVSCRLSGVPMLIFLHNQNSKSPTRSNRSGYLDFKRQKPVFVNFKRFSISSEFLSSR